MIRAAVGLGLVVVVLAAGVRWLRLPSARPRLRGIPTEFVYLPIAIAFGMALLIITPPFQAPDEFDHFQRAWSVADGHLLAPRDGVLTLPRSVADLRREMGLDILNWSENDYSSADSLHRLWQPVGKDKVRQFVATATGAYSPAGYLPQAMAINLVELAGRSPLLAVYLGRLFNLAVAVLLTFLSIRLAPFGKPLFALVGLLPMTIMQTASLSPDALLLSASSLFFALVLFACANGPVRRPLILGLVATSILLCAKPTYAVLALAVLAVPRRSFLSKRGYLWTVGLVVGAAAALALTQLITIPSVSTAGRAYDPGMDAVRQLKLVLHHPLVFPRSLTNTLISQGGLLLEPVGRLGTSSLGLPPFLAVAVYLVAAFLLLSAPRVAIMRVWQRLWLLGVALGVVLAICMAFFVACSAVGAPIISGLQGRHFIPPLLLGMLSVYGLPAAKRSTLNAVLVAAAVAAAIITVIKVIAFYYH